MGRSKAFTREHEPFASKEELELQHVAGALSFFNPTRARYLHRPHAVDANDEARLNRDKAAGAHFLWRSRDNRKGRHALVVPADWKAKGMPEPTNTRKNILKGIGRMFTTFPVWDVSYLVAVFFTIGCIIFIACGLFYWLPTAFPDTEFPDEETTAGGVTSFVGGTLFEIGAVFLMLEAINEHQTGCFGWAVEQAIDKHTYKPSGCEHSHAHSLLKSPSKSFRWFPTWHDLRTHYFHEIGFISSLVEFIGATIFWVNTILALPGVYSHLSEGVLLGLYWLTYLVGGVLFIIASTGFTIETQKNWYTPAPRLLGWWIGIFNLIGSVGWASAASLGYCTLSGCAYQSDLTLIWASISFFIGSAVLWYEAVNKWTVELEKS